MLENPSGRDAVPITAAIAEAAKADRIRAMQVLGNICYEAGLSPQQFTKIMIDLGSNPDELIIAAKNQLNEMN